MGVTVSPRARSVAASAVPMSPCEPLTNTFTVSPAFLAFFRLVGREDLVDRGVVVEIGAGALCHHARTAWTERCCRLRRLRDRRQVLRGVQADSDTRAGVTRPDHHAIGGGVLDLQVGMLPRHG